MREILFRAKRLDDGEWVEGNLVFSLDADEEWRTIIIPIRNSYMFSSGNEDEDLGFENWHRVDPKIVGQYTGLTDKNGVKIFEGDVVSDKQGNIYKVFWQQNYYSFSFVCIKSDNKFLVNAKWELWSLAKGKDLEVAGNIFDNPELMEGGGLDE